MQILKKNFLIPIIIIIALLTPNFIFAENTTLLLNEAYVAIQELQETIDEKNETIENLKTQIHTDQTEINEIRELLKDAENQIGSKKYFNIGLGITYPLGGSVYATADIPFTIFGVGVFASLNKNLLLQTSFGIHCKL